MIKVDFLTIQIKPEAAFCAAADVKVSKEKKKTNKSVLRGWNCWRCFYRAKKPRRSHNKRQKIRTISIKGHCQLLALGFLKRLLLLVEISFEFTGWKNRSKKNFHHRVTTSRRLQSTMEKALKSFLLSNRTKFIRSRVYRSTSRQTLSPVIEAKAFKCFSSNNNWFCNTLLCSPFFGVKSSCTSHPHLADWYFPSSTKCGMFGWL